jgi:hypothetical protein
MVASGLSEDVYELLGFYRDVALCVKGDQCDPNTICGYFFDDIQSFRENYRPLLCKWQNDLGESAELQIGSLLQTSCNSRFQDYCKQHPKSRYCLPAPPCDLTGK